MKQHQIKFTVKYLPYSELKETEVLCQINTGILFDPEDIEFSSSDWLGENWFELKAKDVLNAFSIIDWYFVNVQEIESDSVMELKIIGDVTEKPKKTKVKKQPKLFTNEIMLDNAGLITLENSDITMNEDCQIVTRWNGAKVNLDLPSLFSYFSMKGFINSGKLPDDYKMVIGDPESPILKMLGKATWSLVALDMRIFNREELNGREPGIFDMEIGGAIFRTPEIHENWSKPTIIIVDRNRQFQLEIDVIQFFNLAKELECIKDGKVDLIKLMLSQGTHFLGETEQSLQIK